MSGPPTSLEKSDPLAASFRSVLPRNDDPRYPSILNPAVSQQQQQQQQQYPQSQQQPQQISQQSPGSRSVSGPPVLTSQMTQNGQRRIDSPSHNDIPSNSPLQKPNMIRNGSSHSNTPLGGSPMGSNESIPRFVDHASDRSLPLSSSNSHVSRTRTPQAHSQAQGIAADGSSSRSGLTVLAGTGDYNASRSTVSHVSTSSSSATKHRQGSPALQGKYAESATPVGPAPVTATTSNIPRKGAMAPVNPALSRVFQPLMELIANHSQKLYASSPPELELIVARNPNGGQPKQGAPGSIRNDWDGVWMQLIGNSLSVWSMKETAEADKRGESIPPTYYNITDSSLELLAPLPPPPHRPQSHPHAFVFSLNTAGSNRILLSSPSEDTLSQWVTALRLAAWEKSRIEEIYTGHALRTFSPKGPRSPVGHDEPATWNEPDSPLIKGKMDGWVKVRVMGGTEWKRLWLVLTKGGGGADPVESKSTPEKKRKSLFSFGSSDTKESLSAAGIATSTSSGNISAMQTVASAVFFQSPPPKTSKNSRQSVGQPPVLTITYVSQAYAVFPEHLELITSSNLFKVVGNISGDMVVVEGRPRLSGWAMIMPERGDEDAHSHSHSKEKEKEPEPLIMDMLRWTTGFHDAFGLYGRPAHYNWDPANPQSLFFAYPKAPGGVRLWLETDSAQMIDYRHDVIAQVRRMFANMSAGHLNAPPEDKFSKASPALPAKNEPEVPNARSSQSKRPQPPPLVVERELAPLQSHSESPSPPHMVRSPEEYSRATVQHQHSAFASSVPLRSDNLSPITERSDVASRQTSIGTMNTTTTHRGDSGSSKVHGNALSQNDTHHIKLEPDVAEETLSSPTSSTNRSLRETNEPTPSLPATDMKKKDLIDPMAAPVGIFGKSSHPRLSETRDSSFSEYSQDSPAKREPSVPTIDTTPKPESERSNAATPAAGLVSPVETLARPVDKQTSSPALAPPTQTEIVSPSPRSIETQTTATRLEDAKHHEIADEDTAALYLLSQAHGHSEEPPQPVVLPSQTKPTLITSFEQSQSPPQVQSLVEDQHQPSSASLSNGRRVSLGRKPSGARAMPPKRQASINSQSLGLPTVEDETVLPSHSGPVVNEPGMTASPSLSADAMAALTFLDDPQGQLRSPSQSADVRKPFQASRRQTTDENKSPAMYRSSFAPSQSAAERKARAQAEEQRRNDVLTKPGKAASKPTNGRRSSTWAASSEEDSDDDDDEDDTDDERGEPKGDPGSEVVSMNMAASQASLGRGHPNRPLPDPVDVQRRSSRGLPPIPNDQRSVSMLPPMRNTLDVEDDSPAGNRASSYNMMPPRASAGANNNIVRQTNLWTNSLDAPHIGDEGKHAKFVTLEPSAHMTKAFAPQGLLQAGLQDKEDRSARRQEEVAKETGSSLVNVPNKPPPPQTGLLGAITAHERDRQGAGGIGAALTERERDRRLAVST